MLVKITQEIVYTVTDVRRPSEKHEVVGSGGLQRYVDDCFGGFVEKMFECMGGSVIRDKLRVHEFLMKNLNDVKTLIELADQVAEITAVDEDQNC